MYIVGGGGLAKDPISALRWLGLASSKGHKPSQALFGHMLFIGDGVQPQRAKGLMWLDIAKTGAEEAKDDWIRELYDTDVAAATKEERKQAASMANERKDGLPSFISRSIIKTFEFLRQPLKMPSLPSGPIVASSPPRHRRRSPGTDGPIQLASWPGLSPAIHVFMRRGARSVWLSPRNRLRLLPNHMPAPSRVDGRVKPGHDKACAGNRPGRTAPETEPVAAGRTLR
jgi:hypothetical protein